MNYWNRWFEYILTTGANWKGPIGYALIEIEYKDEKDLRRRLVKASPNNFRIEGNKIAWEFRDLVPRDNIKVYNADHMGPTMAPILLEYFQNKKYEGNKREYRMEDIVITKNENTWSALNKFKGNYTGNVASEDRFVKEMQKIYARLIRNEIFARHGKAFISEDLKRMFGTTKWCKPNPNYSDDMLNPNEKHNIQFILEYEERIK